MITPRLVWALGASQLVAWGVSYYSVAVFGDAIALETGWSRTAVYGGFSAALITMGLVSAAVGRAIDRHGGRPVMTAGSGVIALGCLAIAASGDLAVYYAAWAVLGLGMRMTLYDAAFASLARVGGATARRPISQVTLLGGLASTVLWPIGQALETALGWRGALCVYAGFALATAPLHLMIPPDRHVPAVGEGAPRVKPLAGTPRRRLQAGLFYGLLITLSSFLNSAMSAHMIAIMSGLGMATTLAVWVATLRGVGQSAARLAEVLLGHSLNPFVLGLLATGLPPLGFIAGFWSGQTVAAGIAFALLYGAGNGLITIVRGTQPLLLFDPAAYGLIVGRLVSPSFYLSALAPIACAYAIDRWGDAAALGLSLGVSCLVLAGALGLWIEFGRERTG